MVFTMMPMMSQTVYADDPVYTVTLDPGEGSGDPIVFKSDVNWYESTSGNGSDVPGGNFYRYLEDGKIWFRFPDYKVPDTFTAPDDEYVFDEWTPIDMSPLGHYPISGDVTFTAQWKKDPSLLPESSYSLSPTSYTIIQAGYTDIECVVTSLNLGKFEYDGQPVVAGAIEFTLNKGTLTDGKGGEIPFRVDDLRHWGPYDNRCMNPIDAPNSSFTAAVYIDENDFNAAAPGIYTGTYRIDSKWKGDDWEHEASGDPHYIALTLIVPDPSKSHTVTYEVVNGTWSNDETDPIEEVVVEGEKPSEVPTGMKPSEGYEGGSWSPDPTTTSITGDTKFTYTFTKKPTQPVKISAPTGKTLTYNGKSQTGVVSSTGYTLSGTTKATKAGTYTAKATLKAGYVWTDGSSGVKSISWKINKAANPLTIKAKTATVKGSTKGKNGKLKKTKTLAVSKVIAFTKKGQGKMTYTKSYGSKKITIAKTTGKVTVKKGLKKGTYKVKVKVQAAGNTNYKASAVKTVTFKVKVK